MDFVFVHCDLCVLVRMCEKSQPGPYHKEKKYNRDYHTGNFRIPRVMPVYVRALLRFQFEALKVITLR